MKVILSIITVLFFIGNIGISNAESSLYGECMQYCMAAKNDFNDCHNICSSIIISPVPILPPMEPGRAEPPEKGEQS